MPDIDNSNLCFGTHWNTDLNDAQKQFEAWGFNGIREFTKESVLNGNTARQECMANAKSQNAKAFWVGNYDWGTTADSAVYRFRYSSYTGPLENGESDDAKHMANWSGHK